MIMFFFAREELHILPSHLSFRYSCTTDNFMIMLFYYKKFVISIMCFLCPTCILAETATVTQQKLNEHQVLIQAAAQKLDINPCYLSAVIEVERTLNYDWSDDAWDIPLAQLGKNSSIGFAQVKLKTAYFIERQLHDTDSLFYLGKSYENVLQLSQSVNELIGKLKDDTTNILYAGVYLKLMIIRWQKAGFPIAQRPDILGTLYSTGLFYNDGTERTPNANPKANEFGKKVIDITRIRCNE